MNQKDIGANIRSLRVAACATVDARAGLAKSTLSKIENGQASSPISTLLAVSKALGVPVSRFFREDSAAPSHLLTRKGKGLAIVRDGSHFAYAYEALAAGFPDKPVEPFLLTISPGDKDGRFHHSGHEFIFLLSGRIAFTLADEQFTLTPGDSLYFDPTRTHTLKLIGKTPARFLCLFIETT